MKTLTDLRRELRKVGAGYKVKTQMMSWGRHATYETMEGHQLTGTVFTKEQLPVWAPLNTFLQEHRKEVEAIGREEEIYGLLPGRRRYE
jgi:hypothetical protein